MNIIRRIVAAGAIAAADTFTDPNVAAGTDGNGAPHHRVSRSPEPREFTGAIPAVPNRVTTGVSTEPSFHPDQTAG
ncbi:hypothetical protein ABZU76_50620 [Amycolatopsis sp. NPDC005232]|uniref:hypothetical protein n=1 Tax=Amycolatopsis sp. NPDC005232 TaxID=3157027 RepID=UPI0033BA7B94